MYSSKRYPLSHWSSREAQRQPTPCWIHVTRCDFNLKYILKYHSMRADTQTIPSSTGPLNSKVLETFPIKINLRKTGTRTLVEWPRTPVECPQRLKRLKCLILLRNIKNLVRTINTWNLIQSERINPAFSHIMTWYSVCVAQTIVGGWRSEAQAREGWTCWTCWTRQILPAAWEDLPPYDLTPTTLIRHSNPQCMYV